MSTRGIYGVIYCRPEDPRENCLIIGADVPRVHHTDGLPVFLVVEHDEGMPIAIVNGTKTPAIKNLLAYPSHWPGPGLRSNRWIYAYREPMPWNALIPCFDREEPAYRGYPIVPENMTEITERLGLPLPPRV